MKKTSICS